MIVKYLGENSANEPQIGHTARQLSTQVLAGSNNADVMSNIYDLEGNNVEWTAQAYSTNHRVTRGGNFHNVANYSDFFPVSNRGSYYPYVTFCHGCTRVTLYL